MTGVNAKRSVKGPPPYVVNLIAVPKFGNKCNPIPRGPMRQGKSSVANKAAVRSRRAVVWDDLQKRGSPATINSAIDISDCGDFTGGPYLRCRGQVAGYANTTRSR